MCLAEYTQLLLGPTGMAPFLHHPGQWPHVAYSIAIVILQLIGHDCSHRPTVPVP